jgi:hypothetical protein
MTLLPVGSSHDHVLIMPVITIVVAFISAPPKISMFAFNLKFKNFKIGHF